jgi:hypothetical protein
LLATGLAQNAGQGLAPGCPQLPRALVSAIALTCSAETQARGHLSSTREFLPHRG